MAGTVVADNIQAASTSTLVLKNGVANTPPTIQDSSGTQIGTFCRAWVQFNGTTVTNPASMTGVNGSFNVSSILDNGLGDYTINFSTAMPDANYCAVASGNAVGGTISVAQPNSTGSFAYSAPTTTACRVFFSNNTAAKDVTACNVAIFR